MAMGTFVELVAVLRQLLQPAQLGEIMRKTEGKNLDARAGLGSYVLPERLGEGGMGQAFNARHRGVDRVVAPKLIHKERLDHPQAVKRFRREVQAAAALNHPSIVLAFDAYQCGRTHFLTMEYIRSERSQGQGLRLARVPAGKGGK
jgi:serine/threonine protein kinase